MGEITLLDRVAEDIRSGLGFEDIADKYGLTDGQLQAVYCQLIEAGRFTPQQVPKRGEIPPRPKTRKPLAPPPVDPKTMFPCPKCGRPQSQGAATCKDCGVIFDALERAEKRRREQEELRRQEEETRRQEGERRRRGATGRESKEVQAARDQRLARLHEACANGRLPVIPDPPVILKRGEQAHFVCPVSVVELKTETATYRGYLGTRVKIFGLPIYLGGSAPSKVSNEVLTPVGEGHLVITNRRVVLSGTKINYSTRLDQITKWNLFEDAIQILWEGKYGGRFYGMNDPRPAALILQTLLG